MGKPIFKLDVHINKDYYKQVDLISQWPKRLDKIRPMIGYLAADYLNDFIQSKIPKGGSSRAYRSSLEVAKVRGTRHGENAYAVQVNTSNRLVKNIAVKKALLYVRPTPRSATPSKKVLILQKYGPWTYDTLPFTPDRKEGIVITRPAKSRKVQEVAILRNRQRPQYTAELQKAGVRNSGRDKRLKLPKSVTKLPDVALEAIKLEFGLGGTKPRPGWRVGLSRLHRLGFKKLMKDKKLLLFPLAKPSFNLWKKWPRRTPHSISIGQAGKFRAFQRKIAKS